MENRSPSTKNNEGITDSAANYRFWRKLSRCVRCHTKDAFTMNGRCMCAECTDKDNAYYREYWREHPKFRETQTLHNKKRREFLKASGMCYVCGKRKAAVGKTLCVYCAEKSNRRRREAYAERHTDNMKREPDGMCATCRKSPALEGYKLCDECCRKIVERSRSINHDAHPWRLDNSKMYEEKRTARKQ